jgi:hypothetical protein
MYPKYNNVAVYLGGDYILSKNFSVYFDPLSRSKIDYTLTDITTVISNPFNVANPEK